ncbi:MAG: SAM-dependent chlorinase/fluorinase [Anaerolineaceae bacterium]|nr:SAM-dependent chlorinase/fluorinase [Anaerolineaceae bacterium]
MTACISLTTDFTTGDVGIGEMLGVIYGIAGEDIRIADITHDVPPQNILDAAVILGRHTPYFPKDTVHIVVVDPGVGTHRRPIAARLGDQYFVGPDNGVFSLMYANAQKADQEIKIVHTNNPVYWMDEVSTIFHGRDIFSPVGAHLAAGVALETLGEIIHDPVFMNIPAPIVEAKFIEGIINRVDHFGNLESNIEAKLIADWKNIEVIIGGVCIKGLVKTFGENKSGELVAMIDSSGVIGVSVVNGNASTTLNIWQGDSIKLYCKEA